MVDSKPAAKAKYTSDFTQKDLLFGRSAYFTARTRSRYQHRYSAAEKLSA